MGIGKAVGFFWVWVAVGVMAASSGGAETVTEYNDLDLVSISKTAPEIEVDLRLARTDHPFRKSFYRENESYLRYGTLKKLRAVQADLAEQGLRLRIWCGYRPFSVQVEMYYLAGGNGDWVSDPFRSSGKKTHVRGVAIDCTLVDSEGNELAMPTPYLDFEHGAERMKHSYIQLPEEVLANRKLLKETMMKHGMEPYSGEWWHYQDVDWAKYPIIRFEDFPDIHREFLVPELYEKFAELAKRGERGE